MPETESEMDIAETIARNHVLKKYKRAGSVYKVVPFSRADTYEVGLAILNFGEFRQDETLGLIQDATEQFRINVYVNIKTRQVKGEEIIPYKDSEDDEDDECPDDAVIFEPYDPLHPQYDINWEPHRSRFDNLGE